MKIYIAGKITGFRKFKEKFSKAEGYLKSKGHVCLNPTVLPNGFRQEEYLKICFAMIKVCDAVYMLDNWRNSKGANAEHKFASKLGKIIIYQ